jgi:hypothetical protein
MKNTLAILALAALALVPARAGALRLYATDYTSLYTIDTSTMTYNLIGNYGVSPFIGGLCFNHLGVMYGINAGYAPSLYALDPNSGAATLVGALNVIFVFEGGLAVDPGTLVLYAVNGDDAQGPKLLTVSQVTGNATVVGQIAGGSHDFAGLAFDNTGQLYAVDRVTNALWKIDKNNPSGPGTVQVGPSFGGGIVMGDNGGMTNDAASNVYYCYAGGSRHLFTVNLATGAATALHQFGAADPTFLSLAYLGELPTPGRPTSWGTLKARYR